jgi:hypothetical protein
MSSFGRAVALLLLITTITASPQTRREDEPYCSESGAKRVEVAKADTTILELAIGRSSLQDVQAKLGRSKITRVSRDEESDVSVCYVSPTDGTVLAFYSGAMCGWKDITWFALWSREDAFPHSSQCTSSKLVSRNLSTESGLQLGLTREKVDRILGKPTKLGRTSTKYEYLCRSKMTEDEIKGFKTANNWDVTSDPYFDRRSWIEVHYANSRASRVEIGEIESY